MKETKEEQLAAYRRYKDTAPDGLDEFYANRIDPLIYEIPPGARVLDVGANSGELMKLVAEKRGCVCVGVDLSEVAVAAGKAKGRDVRLGDAENLPFGDNEFDVVLMMETLNHIHDPEKALQEAKRVLKPSGVLLGSVPHKNLEKFVWDDAAPHHPYHDLDSLGVLLDKVFKHSHLWPLKGAQFSVSFAQSFLAGEPAEILFKCGMTGDDHKWWELMRKKDVLRVWFGPTQNEGDVYYRMRCFADRMRDRGVEAAYENYDFKSTDDPSPWQERLVKKMQDGRHRGTIATGQLDAILKVADVSVWQIVSNPQAVALLRCWHDFYLCTACHQYTCIPADSLRACGKCHDRRIRRKPIVAEVDDWLFDVPQYNIASGPYKVGTPMEAYALAQLCLSDAIVCSTGFISEQLHILEQLKDKPTYIIPNCIDFKLWDALKEPVIKKPSGTMRIGYSGCGNHGGDLYMIRDVLTTLLAEFEQLEFIWAVAMKNPHDPAKEFKIDHPRAHCANEWYTIVQFPQVLKNWDLDIGIAPLLDNNFNRAKSNLRWLEYSALRVPTVASAVEPFKRSIRDGSDGRLCRGAQAWYDSLKALILSSAERTRLGAAAYTRVKRDYNLESTTDLYVMALEDIKRKGVSHEPLSARDRDLAGVERSEQQSVVAGNHRLTP